MNALIAAVQKPDFEVFKRLIEQGIAYERVEIDGYPLFIWLASHGRIDFLSYLIQKGVDVNQADVDGNTALILAAENDYADVVDLLIDSDADLNRQNNNLESAASLAAKKQHVKVLKSLIKFGADYSNIKIDDMYLMQWAGTNSYWDLVKIIMGPKIKSVARKFTLAAESNDVKAIDELLDKNSDFKDVKIEGQPLFIWAARYGHKSLVVKLLAKGEDINQIDQYEATALSWAARNWHIDLVLTLLDRNANFNSVQVSGRPLLEWAALNDYPVLVEKLIDLGADYQSVRIDGIPLLQWAISKGHSNIINKLPKEDENIDNSYISALNVAVDKGDVELAQELLEKGADPNQTDKQGYTLLQIAVQAGNPRMVQTLVDHGAAVNKKSNGHESLFITAVVDGNKDIAASIASRHVKNFFKWLAIFGLVAACGVAAAIGIGALVGWAPALTAIAWLATVLTPHVIAIAATAIGCTVVLSYASYYVHNKLKQRSRSKQQAAEKLKQAPRTPISDQLSNHQNEQPRTQHKSLFANPEKVASSVATATSVVKSNLSDK